MYRMIIMNNFNLFLSLVEEVQKKNREIDTTSSFKLLENETASKVKEILENPAIYNIQLKSFEKRILLDIPI